MRSQCDEIMVHVAVHIFAFFAFLAVGWTLFFAWIVGLICRTLWLGFSRLTGRPMPRPVTAKVTSRVCTRLRCRASNPPQANFCRRCGAGLTPAPVRRQNPIPTGATLASGSNRA